MSILVVVPWMMLLVVIAIRCHCSDQVFLRLLLASSCWLSKWAALSFTSEIKVSDFLRAIAAHCDLIRGVVVMFNLL
jgi:hypothetical protein